MSEPERGVDLETGGQPGPRGSLDALPAPSGPDGRVGRSLARLRILRLGLLVFAGCLAVVVVGTILSRRPQRVPLTPSSKPAPSSDDAVQTIEKFKFTSTLSGKPSYSILADRLTGIAGGLHNVEGIRSIQFMRPDGSVLSGHADHGSFVESDSAKGKGPQGIVVLEGHVHLESTAGEEFNSDRLEYVQKEGRIVSPGRATFRLPRSKNRVSAGPSTLAGTAGTPSVSGAADRLEYDMASQTLILTSGVDLTLEEPGSSSTSVRAGKARTTMADDTAELEGGVIVSRERDTLTAPTVHIERLPAGNLHMMAGPGARVRMLPESSALAQNGRHREPSNTGVDHGPAPAAGRSAAASSASQAANPILASADRLEITETPGSHERTIHLSGGAHVEEEVPAGGPAGRSIRAEDILIQDPGTETGRRLHAETSVVAILPPGPGETEPRQITSRTLDALSASGGRLANVEATGSVTIQAGNRHAAAERVTVSEETRAELRGGRPVLQEPGRSIVADEIDLLAQPRRVEARGAVRSKFMPREGAVVGPFAPGEPVDISSERALFTEAPSRGDFQGKVLARQGERALTAPHLVLDDSQKIAMGDGGVSVRTFREEAPRPAQAGSKGAPSGPASTASTAPLTAPRAVVRIPVQIEADSFVYDSARKTTRFEGHAVYRESGQRLLADRIVGAGSNPTQDATSPSEIIAEGHVVLEGVGKRGSADYARYRTDQRIATLEGRERQAELVDTATGRTWRGPSLTWVLTPDSIPVVTGDSGRSRIVGSATGPGQDRVGKKADRGRSR